jgi:hypothetical protein
MLTRMLPALEAMLARETSRRAAEETEKRVAILSELSRLQAGANDLYEAAAQAVYKRLKPSIVRISTFDEDGGFLSSRALVCRHAAPGLAPARGYMVLGLMPRHQQLKSDGVPLALGMERFSDAFVESETGQAFRPGVKSALLVPVVGKDRIEAVISIADPMLDSNSEIRNEDRIFVSSVASLLTRALTQSPEPVQGLGRSEAIAAIQEIGPLDYSTRGKLRSQLSGILGSVEMIRTVEPGDTPRMRRYLEIIDGSARKIGQSLAQMK